jgi:hypothetical protein
MTILKKFSFLFLLPIFFACSDDDVVLDPDLIGTWNLIEQYADPGDGSGDYEPIESDRTITFNEDGTFSSNGNMCGMSGDTTESASGSFSEENGTIDVDDCAFTGFGITYEIKDGYLFIYYPCFEGCGQKYEKAD